MSIDQELALTVAMVVDEGSLDAAARRMHVTPSAVSQRVRSLEEQLGRVLVVRSRPVRATSAGEIVIRLARQYALLEHDALEQFGLRDGGDDQDGALAVIPLAVNADSLASWFLAPLARLSVRHPVVFDLHRDDQDFTAGLLEAGTVMAAVTSRAAPVAGCTSRPLGVLRYEAVAAPDYLARVMPGSVDGASLARAPFIDFDRRDDLQREWLRQRGVDAARVPRHYVPASRDFAEAIMRGLGWGMLPHVQAASWVEEQKLVSLGGPGIDVPLYWQQWNLRSELLDDIAAEIMAEASRALIPVGH